MRKKDELADPKSCLNTAGDDDIVFVLKQKDKAMAATIRFWINERIKLGLNEADDAQLADAEQQAQLVEARQRAKESPVFEMTSQPIVPMRVEDIPPEAMALLPVGSVVSLALTTEKGDRRIIAVLTDGSSHLLKLISDPTGSHWSYSGTLPTTPMQYYGRM